MKPILRALGLFFAVLALAACSSGAFTRLAYNNITIAYGNLAPMLTWMVDDYVDLHGSREDWVRERLDRAIAWHRAEELPRYRAFLESTLALSDAPYRAEDIASRQRELRGYYHRVMERVLPDTAEFLANVDAEDIAHLERKFAEENRRFVRESVRGSPEERVERRLRRFAGHLESWVGPLDAAQRQLLAARYGELRDLSEEMLGERRFRQTEILALARAKPPRDQMQAALRRLLVETDSWRRPEYVEKLKERDARMQALIAELSATLSERQRDALKRRIRGFLRDISTLTAAS